MLSKDCEYVYDPRSGFLHTFEVHARTFMKNTCSSTEEKELDTNNQCSPPPPESDVAVLNKIYLFHKRMPSLQVMKICAIFIFYSSLESLPGSESFSIYSETARFHTQHDENALWRNFPNPLLMHSNFHEDRCMHSRRASALFTTENDEELSIDESSTDNNNNNNNNKEQQSKPSIISSSSSSTKSSKSSSPQKVKRNDKTWNNTSLFPVKNFKMDRTNEAQESNPLLIEQAFYTQTIAALIGISCGFTVAGFKLSINAVRQFAYGGNLNIRISDEVLYTPFYALPVLGAIVVSLLSLTGDFSPGLKGVVNEIDDDSLSYAAKLALQNSVNGASNGDDVAGSADERRDMDNFVNIAYEDQTKDSHSDINNKYLITAFRKAIAAILTLGTGNSLGPEGPGVEIGAAISRLCSNLWPENLHIIPGATDCIKTRENLSGQNIAEVVSRNRLLLACGAAAGVSSGFNAPLSGVFFALEVVQSSLPTLTVPSPLLGAPGVTSMSPSSGKQIEIQQQSFSATSGSIAAILIASVLAALVSRVILGDELALQVLRYDIATPLQELPLYLLLGVACGFVSVAFSQTAKLSRNIFSGNAGPAVVREFFGQLPAQASPIIGGMIGGGIGYFYPQVLFFGYETLNELLNNSSLPTELLLSLLVAKTITTAVSAGSGLVGGILAPSLFLGGMTGASFHNIVCSAFVVLDIDRTIEISNSVVFDLADLPIYSSVGAASVLAAIFRAPLTASLLLFEITRNYDVLLPLLASAGIATLSSDLIESKIENTK